jgi:dTDP-4-dehydrorhamnose reductase
MMRLAGDRDAISVVSDQRGCPTYAGHIAEVVQAFIQRYMMDENVNWGVYHCVGQGEVSWYEFATVIFDEAYAEGLIAKKPTVLPIPTISYPTPANRPMYSVLNTDKLDVFLGRKMPSWREGLSAFLSD